MFVLLEEAVANNRGKCQEALRRFVWENGTTILLAPKGHESGKPSEEEECLMGGVNTRKATS